jgi:Domain of unknown function (DUF4249)
MKNLIFILTILFCISCEEVVTVNLDTAAPRLVIDASINWEKGTSGNVQTIKLTTTAGYYDNVIPKVSGAIVSVKNSSNTVFDFIEEARSGKYTCNNFKPTIGEYYTLTVIQNGQTYVAQEKLMATPPIRDVEQQNDLGLNSDEIGIKVNFIDNAPAENNFSLFRFETTVNAFPEYETYDDQFTQGNVNSWLYSNKKLKKGSEMNFTLYGISETYYNYVSILLSNSRGGAFQPLPIKVKGNIINQNNKDNYALGYFRLSEIDTYDYIVR